MLNCDLNTGVCSTSSQIVQENEGDKMDNNIVVRYIGDPMCSWCWGISNTIKEVSQFCQENNLKFELYVGGLRAGGGDPWNKVFKNFLRTEWQHIAQVTGQTFSSQLLELDYFDYDTEPACRAIIVAKGLIRKNNLNIEDLLNFYTAVQYKFYVDGEDPKQVEFYQSICNNLSLSFIDFTNLFQSEVAMQAVNKEFIQCRQWGVNSFPTLLLEDHGKRTNLSIGYSKADSVLKKLQSYIVI
ncbi:DsbA family protein [Acinetobacter guillouiae]|uniref:DsbA family protein n=1 Tax=Acinetobacter guillouiae TaxID=106649 RepID=UPI00333F44FA